MPKSCFFLAPDYFFLINLILPLRIRLKHGFWFVIKPIQLISYVTAYFDTPPKLKQEKK